MPPQSVLDRLARLEERVSQLEGPAIASWRAEMQAAFAEFRERFDEVDRQFEAVGQRFQAVDRRFEAVDRRFEAIDQRFEVVDQRFGVVDRRLESLERRMQQGFDEARRHSLVLYEDLVARISTIGEALAPAPGRPRRKR